MSRYSLRHIPLVLLLGIIVSCEVEAIENIDDANGTNETVDTQSTISLFETFDGTITLEKTDIIATSGNSILKIVGDELAMSNNLGKTWKYLQNKIGTITYVHWFKNQTCLICGRTRAFWVDSSFLEIHESVVYDYDDSVLNDSSPHFSTSLHGHEDYMTIAGKEVLIWPDYYGEVDGYISRIWYTEDCGKTIKCICKNKYTYTEDGQLINCRHFHDCIVREGYDEIYITSGDQDKQCMLIKGQYLDSKWRFTLLGQGPLFKFDSLYISGDYMYLFCDYTGYGQTGVLRVQIANASDFTKYEYVYICSENLPILRSFKIGKYSFITYDGSVKGKMLFSYDSKPYRNLPVLFGDESNSISFLSNPNNDGLVLARIGSGYNITDIKLNGRMYDFTNGMRAAGFDDFGLNTYE